MEENVTLMDYAVVEDGIITNVLVFDNEETAKEFGCLPLAPYQGIGDKYLTPEEWQVEHMKQTISSQFNEI